MKATMQVPSSGPDGLEEMNRVLAESVPLARQWAEEMCWRDPAGGESCAWYHGAWQTLRLLGIVTTLTHHAPLYIEALRPLIAGGSHKRVFLSGSADYGLLSVVLDAFSQEGVVPDITLTDRCKTPLELCRWYAERYGYRIDTIQADLGEVPLDRTFDLICVHSLLSCIPIERHGDIVATWARLLRPGGVLMMANNLYLDAAETTSRFSADQIAAYRKRVAEAAQRCAHPEALPPLAALEQMADDYASRSRGTVITTRHHLTDLLEAQGFAMEEARFGDLIKDPAHQRSGAPLKAKKEYAWLVARRG